MEAVTACKMSYGSPLIYISRSVLLENTSTSVMVMVVTIDAKFIIPPYLTTLPPCGGTGEGLSIFNYYHGNSKITP